MGRKILFITTDQQRYDALGCNGGTVARTPVVDALAADGIRYERAYNQNTVCMPARSTMLTGQYVRTHGVIANGVPLPEGAPSIAEYLRDHLDAEGLELRDRPSGLPDLRMPYIGEAGIRPHDDPERIAADPEYGRIVCFCERVSRGEIRDAAESPIPPVDLDGLRRRTRALMGRCQGFYCGAHVPAVLAEHTGRAVGEILERTR